MPAAFPRIATRSRSRPRSGGSARNESQTPAGQHRVRAPHRVNGDPLVEVEEPPSVVLLDDLDVLLVRRLLVQQPVPVLDRTGRDDHERREPGRDDEIARPEEEARRACEDRRHDEERPLRPDRGDEDERRQERAEQRSRGRERVETPGDLAGRRDARHGEPDRERRDHAEQDDGRRAEQEHREEAPDDGPCRRLVEPVDRDVEERTGDERDRSHEHRRGEHDVAEERRLGPPVGDPPAEPVADRQRREDDADEVRPHDRRGAEIGGEQPRGGDLGRERSDPGPEDERAERAVAALRAACRRSGPSRRTGLEPEDALDLAQRLRGEEHRAGQREQDDDPEPKARPATLAVVPLPCPAPRTVEPICAAHRLGIE